MNIVQSQNGLEKSLKAKSKSTMGYSAKLTQIHVPVYNNNNIVARCTIINVLLTIYTALALLVCSGIRVSVSVSGVCMSRLY